MYLGLKKTAQEEASNSSFHGISRLAGSEHILRKLMWLCCMAVSYTYCMIIIARNVDDYYTYPVITNINRVYEKQPEFPMVTFCNMNFETIRCGFNYDHPCPEPIRGGNCQFFNRGKNASHHELPILKSEKPGVIFGLYLELDPLYTDPAHPGIELYINNQSVTLDRDKAIRISGGMETSLVISRVFESKLSDPYSTCKIDYTFNLGSGDHFNKTSYPYFQSECFFLCPYQKFFEVINKSEEYLKNFQYYFTNYNKWLFSTGINYNNYQALYPEIGRNVSLQFDLHLPH